MQKPSSAVRLLAAFGTLSSLSDSSFPFCTAAGQHHCCHGHGHHHWCCLLFCTGGSWAGMGTGMGTWMGTGMGIGMAQGWGQGWGQAGVVTDTITYRFGHSYSEGYYSYSEGQGHAHSALMSDYEINSFLSKWSCMQAESGVVSKGRACRQSQVLSVKAGRAGCACQPMIRTPYVPRAHPSTRAGTHWPF